MPKQSLSLASLRALDNGRVDMAFTEEVRKVVEDLNDRPTLDKDRTITLTLKVRPQHDAKGNIEAAIVRWHLDHGIPPRETQPYSMMPTKNGQLFFQPESPEDHRQEGIDYTTGEVKPKQ